MAEEQTTGQAAAPAGAGAEPSFEDILQFDPFESGPGEDQEQAEPQAEQQAPPPAEQAAAPPAVPPTQQPDLRQLINEQTNQLAGVLRSQQTPAQAPPQQPSQRFNLAVPPQLTAALRSEDPQQFEAGVGALINGVANHVWNSVMEVVRNDIMPSIPRVIDAQMQTLQRQQTVATDFYGKYPQLSSDALRPLVQQVGAQIATEFAQAGRDLNWGEQIRDAIAERVFQAIPALRQQVQQATAQQGRRQSFATGNGSRPPPVSSNPQQEMMDVIFGPTR